MRSTGSGCRKARSAPGSSGTTSRPSGFAAALATFARCFVRATPTVTARPASARTRARSRAAIASGEPEMRSSPRTSRNASSIERPSTTGAVSRKIANTVRLAALYASIRGRPTTACGQSASARRPPIALRTPNARAS
jgi:hypothetical protein